MSKDDLESRNQELTALNGQLQATVERQRATSRDLQNILDSSYVIIITTDLEERIVSFNRGAEHSLGYEADEVIGKPVAMLHRSPEEREPLVKHVLQGNTVHDTPYRDYSIRGLFLHKEPEYNLRTIAGSTLYLNSSPMLLHDLSDNGEP